MGKSSFNKNMVGLPHSDKGLMTPSENDPGRTNEIFMEQLNYIIRRVLNDMQEGDAGRGFLIDED